jgi:hypothetical protein
MRNQGQIYIGAAIILIGLLLLIGNVFDVDVGALCLPLGLILLGVWLLLRPQLVGPDTALRMRVFGPIWLFVGDVILDFTRAEIPPGETPIRVYGFVSSIRVTVPQDVGVAVSSTAFVTDARMLGQKRESFLAPVELTSDGYETAERKVRLETIFFVADVRVKQA